MLLSCNISNTKPTFCYYNKEIKTNLFIQLIPTLNGRGFIYLFSAIYNIYITMKIIVAIKYAVNPGMCVTRATHFN